MRIETEGRRERTERIRERTVGIRDTKNEERERMEER